MPNKFEIAGGTIAGRDHVLGGRNNQDAFMVKRTDDALVAVVADGCGSSPHSEVGAQLGTRLCVEVLMDDLLNAVVSNDGLTPHDATWLVMERVRTRLLAEIRKLAERMGGNFSRTIQDYFLFTLVGAVITERFTWTFSLGDGTALVNGDVIYNGVFAGNAPPYLAYGLVKTTLQQVDPTILEFRIHDVRPTALVQSILIGTDGAADLARVADRKLPGKDELAGPLSQFWQEDRYFKNPDMIRRHLALANREVTTIDWQRREVQKNHPLLPDDTTIVVVRRKEVQSWTSM